MSFQYTTKGTCSQKISFDIIDNKVRNLAFESGCHGNLQGISRLVEGMPVDWVISRCENINCKTKGTSCPDQLSRALKKYKEENGK